MDYKYSSSRNVQIVLALFKEYGIRNVVASPGSTNIPFVASMQQDSFFKLYSCVDERSAAYMACGITDMTQAPTVIVCTGATASRNYMPGLTEAYYRKLPVVALTCGQDVIRIGHLIPQVTDRTKLPNDIVVDSATIQAVKDGQDEFDVIVKVNRLLNNLKFGPVHLNMLEPPIRDFKSSVPELPSVRKIQLFTSNDILPELPKGPIAIFCGEHKIWTSEETEAVDRFCAIHDAVVLVDHTSKYKGKYQVEYSIVGSQDNYVTSLPAFSHIIHIGNVSGSYGIFGSIGPRAKSVWRVNPDGAFRDLFQKLNAVFQMEELDFFLRYSVGDNHNRHELLDMCHDEVSRLRSSIPDLPFSNPYIARKIGKLLPDNSILYLGILNSLRTWNYFGINPSVKAFSNVGGFGIDGILSTAVGASFVSSGTLCFAVLGDLSFFYDLNSLGNRSISNNLRVLLINNGCGVEFRHYNNPAFFMGEEASEFVAAEGHWGNKSERLVRHYAEDLGFMYLSARDKDEFENVYPKFVDPDYREKSLLLEVFTNVEDEQLALRLFREANSVQRQQSSSVPKDSIVEELKRGVKKIVGPKGVEIVRILRK